MDLYDILLHDETIFKDLTVFNPDYIPEEFTLRQSQMEEMALSLRPALHGGKPSNNLLLGSPATGKTTAIKKLFEMAQLDCEDDIICVYVNCQIHSTKFSIFSQIHKQIFGHAPPESGVPFVKVYNNIMNEVYDTNKALIVALDDINYLFQKNVISEVFYDILRAHESFEGVRTGIFTVLSDVEFRFVLDKNVGSIFNPIDINFEPYNYEETFHILKERARLGFYQGVITDELIEMITDYTFEHGDLRLGIELLRISGNNAESKASRKIEKEDVEKAFGQADSAILRNILNTLTKSEQNLLRFISRIKDKQITTGDLYTKYNRENKTSYATYNRLINKLEFLRLIDTQYTGTGKKGNSRYVTLRFDNKTIRDNLPSHRR